MFPVFSSNDHTDGLSSNSIFFADISLIYFSTFVNVSDVNNVFFGKNRFPMRFAFRLSSFFHFIFDVILCCTNEKMFRVNTQFIITSMQNKHVIRNISFVNNPRNTMCPSNFPIKKNSSISAYISMCFPNPTSRSFIYFIEKSFFYRYFHRFCMTFFASHLRSCMKVFSAIYAMFGWVYKWIIGHMLVDYSTKGGQYAICF